MKIKLGYIIWGILLLSMSAMPINAVAAIDAPRGVVVQGGDSQYDLEIWWINPSNANLDHVSIYYSRLVLENFGLGATQSDVSANEVSSATISRLEVSTWYYIYLVAVDGEGNESPPSTTIKRRLGTVADVTSPYIVSSASIGSIEDNAMTISWTNPGDNDFYRTSIYRSTESSVLVNETNLVKQQVALPSTIKNYIDSGLVPETTYYYRLVTEDTKGNLGDAVIISGTTLVEIVEEPVVEEPVIDEPTEPIVETDSSIVPSVMPNPALFDYQAQWVSQSGVINDANTVHVITAVAGETITLELTLKNTGSAWWYFESPDNAHEVKIGTWNEADRISLFQANNWLSSNRVSMLDVVVQTGDTVTFSFDLTIPANTASGTYSEYFRPVSEYVEWFGPTGIFWQIEVT